MKRRNVLALLASGTVAAVALAIGKFFPSSNVQQSETAALPSSTPPSGVNPIVAENAAFGTTGWMIPSGAEATIQIQAYVSARSVAPGQSLTFFVSTQEDGTSYVMGIY